MAKPTYKLWPWLDVPANVRAEFERCPMYGFTYKTKTEAFRIEKWGCLKRID